jgi:DNA-binding NtrC family response regulator
VFDCILIDDLLPDATGLDVLESLRQHDGALSCAVIMIAAARTADASAAVIKAGALDYLATDRLDADALRRAIRRAVTAVPADRRTTHRRPVTPNSPPLSPPPTMPFPVAITSRNPNGVFDDSS